MLPTNICFPTYRTARNAKCWGDGTYQGQGEATHAAAPKAQDMICRRTRYKNHVDKEAKRKNTTKARVRVKVEYPFRVPEANLWLYESAIPRPEEESRMAMRGLRPGELVPTPQPAGPRGVVSLEAGQWASAIKQTTSQARRSRAFRPPNAKTHPRPPLPSKIIHLRRGSLGQGTSSGAGICRSHHTEILGRLSVALLHI